jgi:sulfite dehydrogenase
MWIVLVAAGLKAALFVLFLVLIPTVPLTWLLSRSLRTRRETTNEVFTGRSPATPFALITIIGAGATAVVLIALLITVGAQWMARNDGPDTDPVAGDAGSSSGQTSIDAQTTPEQGNPTLGKKVFARNDCGSCHTMADAGASGTIGPDLDVDQPDFSRVVECVTTGPGDMPKFTQLSNGEIRDLAKYISTVAGHELP